MIELGALFSRHDTLWWASLVVALLAGVFRLARPAERRALRATWVLLVFGLASHAGTALATANPLLAQTLQGYERSLQIAADICIYTNRNLVIEELPRTQEIR